MIAILSKLGLSFLSSRFVTVMLLVLVAGAVWWLTAQIKQAELTEQANQTLIGTIDQQKTQITILSNAVQQVTRHAATINSYDNKVQQKQLEVSKLVQSNENETLDHSIPVELISSMCESGQFTDSATVKYCGKEVATVSSAESSRY